MFFPVVYLALTPTVPHFLTLRTSVLCCFLAHMAQWENLVVVRFQRLCLQIKHLDFVIKLLNKEVDDVIFGDIDRHCGSACKGNSTTLICFNLYWLCTGISCFAKTLFAFSTKPLLVVLLDVADNEILHLSVEATDDVDDDNTIATCW